MAIVVSRRSWVLQEFDSENHPVLQVIENTGHFSWLGVRDDFRTWFLHYHFRSKADLARAIWLRIASSFVPGILQMMASDLSLDEKIDQFVDAYHRRLTRHPYLLPYVISEAARHPDLVDNFYSPERREAARRMIDKLREQIDDVVKARRIAPVSAEPFFITLAGSCLYPFAARPMISEALGLSATKFEGFTGSARTQRLSDDWGGGCSS